MIRFEHVGFRYGVGPEILTDVNFTLEPGSFHFLNGPSGAGKTSLMSLLYLGRKPSRGLVTMFGQQINDMEQRNLAHLRQKIGVVFQEFRLLPHLSAFDNVALPLRIIGTPEKEIRNNVGELLEWVGLGDYTQSLPQTLSGGQQQRIAIARAVIARPKLLLADEPTGNLDDEMGFRLMNLFEQLNNMGTTIVIATHSHAIMDKFGHPRLILDNGHLEVQEPKSWVQRSVESVF
ncbi:MAG: cell division ATP-binding protein FtsE [Micavibrio sp. TMED27]|nr:cell division ATP-binding protein FtsE [Micavibrio sp.]OUT91953.1 MAG: cell division ATP-binding protein FtsE [Micavibrio sp. TMED27]